jgi:hypothetical protein
LPLKKNSKKEAKAEGRWKSLKNLMTVVGEVDPSIDDAE